MGSLIPESEALEFESAARGESHTWRATREFALLGEILGAFEWGTLDLLLFDLPPGAERTVQYADFLGAADVVPAGDDPVRGRTGRGRAFGGGSLEGTEPRSRLRREHERLLLPRLQRHQAAVSTAREARVAWRFPVSGPSRSIPSSPGTAIAVSIRRLPDAPVGRRWSILRSSCWTDSTLRPPSLPGSVVRRELRPTRSPAMKFLCVPCDSPMKLQAVGPPEGGSLSVVYSCPECGYEMAMLTNPSRRSSSSHSASGLVPTTGAGLRRARAAPLERSETAAVADRRERQVCPSPAMGAASRGPRRGSGSGDRPGPVDVRPPKRGSRTSPRSSVRWRGPASRNSPARRGAGSGRDDARPGARLLRHVMSRLGAKPPGCTRPSPAVRHLLESHLSLQSRLRALLSRRRRHAPGRTARTSPIGASSAPRNASR